jgi:DNA-3-methyladenine glycosylase
MERQRGTNRLLDLTRGPGRLAEAFGIDRSVDGVDLCSPGPLWLGEITSPHDRASVKLGLERHMGVSRRIGITRAAHRLLRFYERGSRFVSGTSRLRA